MLTFTWTKQNPHFLCNFHFQTLKIFHKSHPISALKVSIFSHPFHQILLIIIAGFKYYMSFCATSFFFFLVVVVVVGWIYVEFEWWCFLLLLLLLLCSELRILEVLDQRVCLDFVGFLSNLEKWVYFYFLFCYRA